MCEGKFGRRWSLRNSVFFCGGVCERLYGNFPFFLYSKKCTRFLLMAHLWDLFFSRIRYYANQINRSLAE